jgi:hypothetical protein
MWRLDLPISERQVTFVEQDGIAFSHGQTGVKKTASGDSHRPRSQNRGPVKIHSSEKTGTHAAQLNQPISAFQAPRLCNPVRQTLFKNRSIVGKN